MIDYYSSEYDLSDFLKLVENSFDCEFYLSSYNDVYENVTSSSDKKSNAWLHYVTHGLYEGRRISPSDDRPGILKLLGVKKSDSLLEIGPFVNPFLLFDNVKYFEILDKKKLVQRAKKLNYQVVNIPNIDFVDKNGDLSVIDEKFDIVLSSHCIEHQPDLINHLNRVSEILNEGGKYYIICPDKRYCFDHFNSETKLIDVIAANLERRKLHPKTCIFEHRTYTAHNAPDRHWKGDHGELLMGVSKLDAIKTTIAEINSHKNSYIDVHSWIFTPLNFSGIIQDLNDLQMINLKISNIYPTTHGRNEFIVVLEK